MIRIYSLYGKTVKTDITNFCKTITWSGDVEQYARKLEVTIAYSIFDKKQSNTQIGPGTLIWMIEDGKEIFRGYVFDREISSSAQELKFVAFDFLIYFLKSKGTYNFQNVTPEDVLRTVCKDAGVEAGDPGNQGMTVSFIAKGKPFVDIVMQAYTYVHKAINGKYNYMPYMDGAKFNVRAMGILIPDFILKSYKNIENATYSDTLSNMINRINVYDKNGDFIGTAQNTDWVNNFGVLQDTLEQEDGKDGMTQANGMLHGVDTTISVSCLGYSKCISGYAIKSEIKYIDKLDGITLYIDADTHTWEVATGKHTMNLTLNTTCKMKLIEEG